MVRKCSSSSDSDQAHFLRVVGALTGSLFFAPFAIASDLGMAATLTSTSDYDYRGVSQSASDPALQAGVDYTSVHTQLEVWTSTVRFSQARGFFGSRHTEVAYTANLFAGAESSLKYGLGISYFTYPGWHPGFDYPELAATLSHHEFVVAFHYTWKYSNEPPNSAAYYIELENKWPLGYPELMITAHGGLSWGEYWKLTNDRGYADASVGLQYAWRTVVLGAEFVDTRGYKAVPRGQPFSGKGRVIVTISTSIL